MLVKPSRNNDGVGFDGFVMSGELKFL